MLMSTLRLYTKPTVIMPLGVFRSANMLVDHVPCFVVQGERVPCFVVQGGRVPCFVVKGDRVPCFALQRDRRKLRRDWYGILQHIRRQRGVVCGVLCSAGRHGGGRPACPRNQDRGAPEGATASLAGETQNYR